LINDGEELEKTEDVSEVSPSDSLDGKPLKRIPIGYFASLKLSFQRILLPLKCCNRCHNRRDKLAHAADIRIKEEIKIVRWIKHNREVKNAFGRIFTKEEWDEIYKEANTMELYIDDAEDKVKLKK